MYLLQQGRLQQPTIQQQMFTILRHSREREPNEQSASKVKEPPTVSRVDWSKSVHKEQTPALKIHIYNFLITEGHFDVAQTFGKQAGISPQLLLKYKNNPQTNQQATSKRLEIKALIKNNQIDQAISKLKQFELTSKDQKQQEQLIFSLLCLKTVNLIKQGKFEDAILNARTDLLPLVNKKTERNLMLEKVMSLIAFVEIKQCQNSGLLDVKHKNSLAEQVNTYLLGKNSPESLKNIISVGKWLQKRLQSHMKFPHLNPWSHELYQK